MQEMEPPLLVYSTHLYGIKLSKSETSQVLLAFGVFYSDQLKYSLGNNQKIEESNLMMALKLRKLMLPTFFISQRFYCVETICAPCGVVIAWTKFDRSESTTKILEQVYPSQLSRPDHICIDKACQLL